MFELDRYYMELEKNPYELPGDEEVASLIGPDLLSRLDESRKDALKRAIVAGIDECMRSRCRSMSHNELAHVSKEIIGLKSVIDPVKQDETDEVVDIDSLGDEGIQFPSFNDAVEKLVRMMNVRLFASWLCYLDDKRLRRLCEKNIYPCWRKKIHPEVIPIIAHIRRVDEELVKEVRRCSNCFSVVGVPIKDPEDVAEYSARKTKELKAVANASA